MNQPRLLKIILIILTFICGMTFSSPAQAASDVTWYAPYFDNQISLKLPVQNAVYTSFDLPGQVSGNYSAMLVKIAKDSDSTYYYFPVQNSQTQGKVYLRFGKGIYKIEVNMVKPSQNSAIIQFDTVASFTMLNLTNEDERYLLPSWGIECEQPLILETAISITRNAKTDLEKVQAIHDWVAQNVAYDMEKYHEGNFYEVQGALKTLITKKGLCRDYSDLTSALCRSIGIEARTILGVAGTGSNKGGHAWNEVKIDDKWIKIDTTWDAGVMIGNKFVSRFSSQYFNMNEVSFNTSHQQSGESW